MENIHISRRQPENSWKFEELSEHDPSLFVRTIDHNISFDDIYDEVNF